MKAPSRGKKKKGPASSATDAVELLKKYMAGAGVRWEAISVHEEKALIRVTLQKGTSPTGAMVMCGRLFRAGDAVSVIIPVERVVALAEHRLAAPKYGTRMIYNDTGEPIEVEYAVIPTVGVSIDGSFTLDALGRGRTGIAGVVPFNDKGNPTRRGQ